MFASRAGISAIRSQATQIRRFHASGIARKSATEKVSEVADKVNKKLGKGLANAIDKGEKATATAKEVVGKEGQRVGQEVNAKGRGLEDKARADKADRG